MDFTNVKDHLEKHGFAVRCFETAAAAADWLDGEIDGATVSFGGSVTLQEMGLGPRLAAHNELYWHWLPREGMSREELSERARGTEVFLTSVNGLAETGELINIDGTGNRVAATFCGHKRVYFVVGRNKLAKDYESALWRARNIAAPKNAQRLGRKTPCAAKGDRCYDCDSPERICCGLSVLWRKMFSSDATVVLIDQELGY